MERELFYDLLIHFFNLNVDFSIIFQEVDEPVKKEILNFVEYVKTKPLKKDVMEYKLSLKAKNIIITYIDYIMNKTKK